MQITIYHNPACGTSRNALANIRVAGHDPRIVEYMKTPLTRTEIAALLAQMNMTVRQLVRSREPLYRELGLDEKDVGQEELLDALAEHPSLINRPIVVVESGGQTTTRLCRPSDLVKMMLVNKQTQS